MVRKAQLRGAAETSPARRRMLRSFFRARNALGRPADPARWTTRARALGVWDIGGLIICGWHCRSEGRCRWDTAAAATCGVWLSSGDYAEEEG